MKFGYFDDEAKEYVITRPDTPKSWSNYLGSTLYGAIITNNAGGYSFYKSGGMGRFMRIRFNAVPMDQPGRYIYFQDKDSKDYWSASWQPVGRPLDEFKSVCRHGTGYTVITSEYKNIKSEVAYFVPLNSTFEVWKVKVSNNDKRQRKLNLFTYVEYAGSWNAIDDLLNIQYVQYIATMKFVDGMIDHGTNINIPEMPDNFKEKDQGRHTFQAITGLKVKGFDTDREQFLGAYRTYANPLVVEKGLCNNLEAYGDNPCGCLQAELELDPGESAEFAVLLGIGRAEVEGRAAVKEYSDLKKADFELTRVKEYWHQKMKGFSAATPDNELNSTINTWGVYNSLVTFAWSRAASLIYSGIDRDGLGYRDTVQDFLGVVHATPAEVGDRLELMITGQASTGGAMPVILPFSHHPGKERPPEESAYRSDDSLWLFNAIPAWVKETGEIAFYHKILPYADKGESTVFGHMKRAIEFNLERSGEHGLPYGLSADWNDCLKFGYKGESVFVAMQLRLALKIYVETARLLNDKKEEHWGNKALSKLDGNIQQYTWDGEWFLRGYRQDGMKFGAKSCQEGKIFLNPQVWSVISGAANAGQAESAMDNVSKYLATEYGLMLCDPPYTNTDYTIIRAQLFNPGLKENGGIFIHTQGWAVIAEAMLGRGNKAYNYLRAYLPAAFNNHAEIRETEPYVVCQSTHSKYSPGFGKSRIPWLSGSATWTFYAITQYILGIRPDYQGLVIDPCIPSNWKGYSVERIFRGKRFSITVKNERGVEHGVQQIVLNNREITGNLIGLDDMEEENDVLVVM